MPSTSNLDASYNVRTERLLRARGWALSAAVAGALFAIAYDGGGYALTSRNTIAVLALWTVGTGVAIGAWPRAGMPAAALAVGGLLAAFALWAGLSTIWSASVEKSFNEANRAVLYLALFLLVVVSSRRGRGTRRWIRGLAIGIAGVGLLALLSRLFPHRFGGTTTEIVALLFPSAENRLSYPVGYWNGLATLLALGVPFLLFVATTERRAVARGLALAPLPALGVALYLTSSRGGIIAAALAALVYLALTNLRWQATGALLVAGAASVGATLAVIAQDTVIAGEPAHGEGLEAALYIALACASAGALYAIGSRFRFGFTRARKPLGWALVVIATLLLVTAAVAANPRERFENFKSIPSEEVATNLQAHLVSGSGNGRWQLWQSAAEQFKDHPIVGDGAGSYEAWWAQHGTVAVFVRDAHSLYLETLAELGLVGFAILVAALLAVLVIGVLRVRKSEGDGRAATAALLAALTAYLFEAGFDWMWEMTVVSLVALVCVGLLTGPATCFGRRRSRGEARGPRWSIVALRAAGVLAVLVLVVAQGIPLVAQAAVGRSQDAVQQGDPEKALAAAKRAERMQPWAASTHLQRALVEELTRNFPAARMAIRHALERDAEDWRLWIVAARIETKVGAFREAQKSLARAIELNPNSRILSRFKPAER
jgi:O-antigen ligase